MSANKENMNVKEKNRPTKEDTSKRNPLKTLSYHNNVENCLAGPSQGTSRILDTRYVTYKRSGENIAIYKPEPILRTDGKTDKTKHNENKTGHEKAIEKKTENNSNDDNVKLIPVIAISANTPLVIISTPYNVHLSGHVKRVKRSLKRPQEREQRKTISPVSAKSCQFTIYSNIDIKLHNNIPPVEDCFDPLNEVYTTDNLSYLLQSERKVAEPRIRKTSRACVINWIINVNGSSGNPAVVQLASWYFDYYLSSTLVPVNRLQVIAAACFWVATKFHGRSISAKRLVKYSGLAFVEKELESAERSILKKLFQVLPVVPSDFVPYLSWCSDRGKAGLVEAAAVFLCQCGVMTDKVLADEFPSVVAAAAVKNALLLLKMESCLKKLEACVIYKSAANKAFNLHRTCFQLRDAVRVVASVGYEYKAPLFKFSGPPYYISNNIVRAVNHKDVVQLDMGNF